MASFVARQADFADRVLASTGLLKAGVIGEARRRQHRRRLLAAAWGSAGLALALVILVGVWGPVGGRSAAGQPPPGAPTSPGVFLPAGAVLSQAPFLGVSCPLPNSIACDRIGLAINLRRPAVSVNATIGGWPVALVDRGDVPALPGRKRTEFDGFLQPAGIVNHLHVKPDGGPGYWYGDSFPAPVLVRLRVDYGRGKPVVTQTGVAVATGWG